MVAKKEISNSELIKMLTGVQQMLHWQMDLVEDALHRLATQKPAPKPAKSR